MLLAVNGSLIHCNSLFAIACNLVNYPVDDRERG